jgi:uncharacterized damage-inducible protein DinB
VPTEHTDTEAFRGARFKNADLSGASFRDCDLTGVRIISSQVDDLRVDGFAGRAGKVVVDDVDVTEFVGSELDRRYPERVQLRAMRTADDYRAMWDVVDRLWSDTVARAEQLSETKRHERVDDEWSFVETLQHLVFAIDIWVTRMILGELTPCHPLGVPPTDYPAEGVPELGIDVGSKPSFREMVALHEDRKARVSAVVAAITDTQLEEIRTAAPAPAWGVESHSVGACLRVVMNEHCQHRRFALRDLAKLETS